MRKEDIMTRSTRPHPRAALLLAALAAQPLLAGDLSPLSDFYMSPIDHESAFLTQTGTGNLATVDQGPGLSVLTGLVGQYAEITQTGTQNRAQAAQMGDANRLRVVQDGFGNDARIVQTGDRNVVDLSQTGNANLFSAVQTGNDNLVVGIQPGAAAMNLTQVGNHNVIDIDQRVYDLNVTIEQRGDNLTVRQR
jgi:minor curlin subunit